MKILIFSLTYFPFVGGAEIAVKEITDRLPDFEFDMITVNLDGKQKEYDRVGNINIHRVGYGKISKYFFPFQAKKLAQKMHAEKKYHAIWAIMANQAGLTASFFKKSYPDIPFLLTLQEGDSELDIWLRTWYIRPMYKNIYRRADSIQAISNFLGERAKKLGARCPVEVVPNGVTSRSWKQETGSRKYGEKIIITTSRLVRKNAVDILIKAFKQLLVTGYSLPVTLKILGQGSLEGELKQLAKNLGLENSVKFVGHVEPEKIYDYLQKADIFIRPSRSEGLGSSFLEAMSIGLPVIGTPVGGIPDFLKDGETGLFCKVDDPRDLAQKIQMLLNDENLYKKLSENGKKLVEKKYQWDGITKHIKEIFYSIFPSPTTERN